MIERKIIQEKYSAWHDKNSKSQERIDSQEEEKIRNCEVSEKSRKGKITNFRQIFYYIYTNQCAASI